MAHVLNNSSSLHLQRSLGSSNVENSEDAEENQMLNIRDVFEAIMLADPWTGAMTPPYVQIIEQPASKALRFRYKCECQGRSAGSLQGANTVADNKTYPTIKVHNYTGKVIIQVSCVTKDEPYRPHPHNLIGREHCHHGVYTVTTDITPTSNEYQFKHIGIQCVKKQDFTKSLKIREQINVDPFRTGFSHVNNPRAIELSALRLCVQVLAGGVQLAPVVTDVVYDSKAREGAQLHILRASCCSGTTIGGTRIIILCEPIVAKDTEVVFFLQENESVVWERSASTVHVHRGVALVVDSPAFRSRAERAHIHFQLKRISDGSRSNALRFEYYPEFPDKSLKRQRVNSILESYHSDILLYQTQRNIKTELEGTIPSLVPQYRNHTNVSTPAINENTEYVDASSGTSPKYFPSKMSPQLPYLSPSCSTMQTDSQSSHNQILHTNISIAHPCPSTRYMQFNMPQNNPVFSTTQLSYAPDQLPSSSFLHTQASNHMTSHEQFLSPSSSAISSSSYDPSSNHMARISSKIPLVQQNFRSGSCNFVQQMPIVEGVMQANVMSGKSLNPFNGDVWEAHS